MFNRKFIFLLVFLLIFLFSGCTKKPAKKMEPNNKKTLEPVDEQELYAAEPPDKFYPKMEKASETVTIPENVFVLQTDDIYNNFDDYKDKNIEIEGMFDYYFGPDGRRNIPAAYRRSPGCCGDDGITGFPLELTKKDTLPEENDWVKVVGRPVKSNITGMETVALRVISIEKMDTRGLEFVDK